MAAAHTLSGPAQTFHKTRKTMSFSRKSQQCVNFKLTGTNAGVMGTNTDENNDIKATKDEEDAEVKVSELEDDEDDGNYIKGEEDKVRRSLIMQIAYLDFFKLTNHMFLLN